MVKSAMRFELYNINYKSNQVADIYNELNFVKHLLTFSLMGGMGKKSSDLSLLESTLEPNFPKSGNESGAFRNACRVESLPNTICAGLIDYPVKEFR